MAYDRLIPAGERPDPLGWVPVSPRLASARRLVALLTVGLLALVALVVSVLLAPPWVSLVVLVVAAAVAGWSWWLIGRQVAAVAYSERTDDLLVRSGILVRRMVVVPYGRMQLVDLTTGPLDRRFCIASVQLHTAAAATDARIPGLPEAEAARLRDHLAALGEARSAGL